MVVENACDRLTIGGTTPALVVGGDGRVRCANRASEHLFTAAPGGLDGVELTSLLGAALGREVLTTARRAMAELTPRFSVSMWRGYWARGRFTPVELDGERLCIIAAEPWTCPLGSAADEPLACDELTHQDLADLATLTPREAEVLWWLACDASVPEIARRLSRSTKTIESHIRALSAKTGRSGRLALARLAIERGIARMTLEQVARVFGPRRGGQG